MSVALALGVTAALGAILAAGMTLSRRMHVDVVDPEAQERAVVRAVTRHPRVAGFVRRRLDPTTASGLLLTGVLVVGVGASVLVGWLLTMVNDESGLADWDEAIAEWGSANATEASTEVMEVVTALGGTPVVVLALSAVGVVDFLRHRNRDVLLFLATVGGGVLLINNVVKWVVERERPEIDPLTGFAGSSFPSGHTASAAACWAAIALVLGRHQPRGVRALLTGIAAAIAIAVAVTRALLGVHWFTDVLAGLALGWGWFTVVAIVFGGRIQRLGEPVERVQANRVTRAPRDRITSDGSPR